MGTNQAPKRVLGYARVSGSDPDASKNELALDRRARLREQLARLDAYAHAMSWPKPIHFSEIESGGEKYGTETEGVTLDDFLSRRRGEHRKEQRRLLEELRPGDLILVVKDDRWSRDARFDADTEDFIRARGARMEFVETPGAWDAAPIVKGVLRLTKEQERAIIRERLVGARDRQRDAGCWVEGLVPFGYERAPRVGMKRADRFLHPHADHAPIVVQAFERCVAGESIETISDWLRTLKIQGRVGARRWSKKDMGKILRDRVYLGQIRNTKGTWIDAHDAIIKRALFDAAQKALTSRRLGDGARGASSKVSRTADWVLRSIAACKWCGLRMGPAYRENRAFKTYGKGERYTNYYVCGSRTRGDGCENKFVRQDGADAHAAELALEYLQGIRKHLVADKRAAQVARDTVADRKRLMAKRGRVIDLFEEGDINAQERRTRLDAIKAELDALDAADRETIEASTIADPSARRTLLTELDGLREAWDETTGAEKRDIIARLASAITLDASREKPVRVEWKPLDELLRGRTRAAR